MYIRLEIDLFLLKKWCDQPPFKQSDICLLKFYIPHLQENKLAQSLTSALNNSAPLQNRHSSSLIWLNANSHFLENI